VIVDDLDSLHDAGDVVTSGDFYRTREPGGEQAGRR
jgi:hypothetical protein